MNIGYIKLHRSILDWQYWDDHNTTRLLIFFLVSVNFEPKKWKGIQINAGQLITSYDKIAMQTKLSTKQIRRSIKILVECNEIAQQTTNKFQLITLIKWEELQIEENNRAGKGQAKGTQRAGKGQQLKKVINKEIKNTSIITTNVDNNTLSSSANIDFDGLLKFINKTFGKMHILINDSTKRKYLKLLKKIPKENLNRAIMNCKNSDFHKKSKYRFCTPEYFSRFDTIEKWGTESVKQNSSTSNYNPRS